LLPLLLVPLSLVLASCHARPASSRPADVFADVDCKDIRAPVEPDLVAWEPELRTQLDKLRRQSVVAVRYEANGCDVSLELIPQCVGPKNRYVYSPFKANETKVAHDLHELVRTTPVGAANVAGVVKDKGELRTELNVVGSAALPPGTTITDYDLVGPECKRATHVVSAVYVGGYAMGATHEGDPRICERAAAEGIELSGCAVPLRVALVGIGGRNEPVTVAAKRAVVEEKAQEGTFDQASIERIVREHQGSVKRQCWDGTSGELRRITVNVTTTVDTKGRVARAEPALVEAEGPSEMVSVVMRCISGEIQTWRFPEPPSQRSVTLPFHLMRQ
jgi:hypothetical protein